MRTPVSPFARTALRRLVATTGSAMLIFHLASPALAEPAMWVVKDEDSTIYLLGTFHLVKPDTHWRSDKIAAALKSSDELWLEASESGDAATVQGLVLKYGLDLSHPLSTKLGSDDMVKLQAAAKDADLSAAALEPMRPWLAALTLSVAPLVKKGYDPKVGVDRQLESDATAAHKPVKTFETPEQQILFFARLPERSEVEFLSHTLDELSAGTERTDQLANAWADGDIKQLDTIMVKTMKVATPELYDTLIVKRNLDWGDKIAAMMKGSGTIFVAVGAGHLVGDRSLQAILMERGFNVAPY